MSTSSVLTVYDVEWKKEKISAFFTGGRTTTYPLPQTRSLLLVVGLLLDGTRHHFKAAPGSAVRTPYPSLPSGVVLACESPMSH